MASDIAIGITVNAAKLTEELRAWRGSDDIGVSARSDGTNARVILPDGVILADVQAILDAHNPALLTDTQKNALAANVALIQGKLYLRKQLVNANPNVATIYTTVKGYVDGNAHLLQMVNNQIALAETAFVWTLNLITPAAIDRTRYLFCVQMVIALLT